MGSSKINLALISEAIPLPEININLSEDLLKKSVLFLEENPYYIDNFGNIVFKNAYSGEIKLTPNEVKKIQLWKE